MMYIFEGVDAVGKDTLIEKVREHVEIPLFDGLNVYHEEQYPALAGKIEDRKQWQKAIDWEVINFCKQTGHDVIMNRFIWSEIVYANVFRGGADPFFTETLWNELEGIAKVIYLEAPSHVIQERLEKRGKPKKLDIVNHIIDLKNEFEKLIANSNIPVHRVDTTKEYNTKVELWEFVGPVFYH